MLSVIISLSLILVLLLTGKIFEAIRRLLLLVSSGIVKLLSIFGIRVKQESERRLRVSKQFKETYKGEIKRVMRSPENKHTRRSINIVALIILLLSLSLLIYNIQSDGVITKWLYKERFLYFIVGNYQDMNLTFIAFIFSLISFSISGLIHQWNRTREYRIARRDLKLKNRMLKMMSSKELLVEAQRKDLEAFEENVVEEEENSI